MCPHCRQHAPIIYRGIVAYCTACGAVRPPLAGTSVTLAGQPSKVGGTVARVFGWLVLAGGTITGGISLALLLWLFPGSIAGWVVGLPIIFLGAVVGLLFLAGGRTLSRSGESAALHARTQAIFAIAAHRGGLVTALEVSQALRLGIEQADTLLTDLAKQRPDFISIDVDDATGAISYRFSSRAERDDGLRARIDAAIAAQSRVASPPMPDELVDEEPEASRQRAR